MQYLDDARRKNLEYQHTYGSYHSVHDPHWSGSEGDQAALQRMVWPTAATQAYFDSPHKNAFIRNLVTTALQGQGKTMSDAIKLKGQDDYTPQIGRTKNMTESGYQPVAMQSYLSGTDTMLYSTMALGVLGIYLLL